MKISLANAGKRFNREWIFRNANLAFDSGRAYAVTGPNGSGKSTLLQAIGGMLQLSEGSIQYARGKGQWARGENRKPEVGGRKPGIGNQQLNAEEAYKAISFCAPYMEVIEEMTLLEFLTFHQTFKPFLPAVSVASIVDEIGLGTAAQKQIRQYSSGMKQRVKLAQAIYSDTAAVLLDEPCSNLDANGIALYHSLINNRCKDRLVIVCSNDEVEYGFCDEVISVLSFKSAAWR